MLAKYIISIVIAFNAITAQRPGSRDTMGYFLKENTGELYIIGGYGVGNVTGGRARTQNTWSYSILTNQWQWITGSPLRNAIGSFGTRDISAITNTPGSRFYPAIARNQESSRVFLFGGDGFTTSTSTGRLNDLWEYNLLAGNWTWISGNSALNAPSVFVSNFSPFAIPSGRISHSMYYDDATGNLFLFGGNGKTDSNMNVYLNGNASLPCLLSRFLDFLYNLKTMVFLRGC
jgi:hypothetical protein